MLKKSFLSLNFLIEKFFHDLATPINSMGLILESDNDLDALLKNHEKLLRIFLLYRLMIIQKMNTSQEFKYAVSIIDKSILIHNLDALDKSSFDKKFLFVCMMMVCEGQRFPIQLDMYVEENSVRFEGQAFHLKRIYQEALSSKGTAVGFLGLLNYIQNESQKQNYDLIYTDHENGLTLRIVQK